MNVKAVVSQQKGIGKVFFCKKSVLRAENFQLLPILINKKTGKAAVCVSWYSKITFRHVFSEYFSCCFSVCYFQLLICVKKKINLQKISILRCGKLHSFSQVDFTYCQNAQISHFFFTFCPFSRSFLHHTAFTRSAAPLCKAALQPQPPGDRTAHYRHDRCARAPTQNAPRAAALRQAAASKARHWARASFLSS